MAKDKDLMRDTGGAFKTKDLQRPERPDRRTVNHDGDRDFDDVRKDRDFKACIARTARDMRRMARTIVAFKNGEIEQEYSIDDDGKSVLVSIVFDDGKGDEDFDMLVGYDLAANKLDEVERGLKDLDVIRKRDTLSQRSFEQREDAICISYDISRVNVDDVRKFLEQKGFKEGK